jgi:hypothetical protein
MSSKRFVHVVNFWLRKDLTDAQRAQFKSGVLALEAIKTLDYFHVGTPASTDRPVIDRSYDYCLLCIFKSKEDHDLYQVDPIHDKFRETCGPLSEKLLIYDSEAV